jgi:chromosome segregation ATPase
VLTSYPGISQRTRQMLKMNSHNSKLTLALSKLHDQVNDMQNKLTQQEEVHEKEISDLNAEKAILGDEIERKKNAIVALFKEKNELQASNSKLQTKVKQTIKKSTIDPEKIQQNEAKEVEKPLKEESILNHSMSPKSTPEKIPKPLITLEDVKKENNRSVDEAVPKKDSAPLTIESSPKEKVATQDLKKSYFQKSTNQSNSPPSLSFLFKSSSSQDEQNKSKVVNNEGPKHTKTLEPKASSSSFSFLFSSNDTAN